MTENKFTPGPWEVHECTHGGGLLRRGDQLGRSMHVQSSLQILPLEDARLIAAAPDLLAAVKAFRADHEAALGCYLHDAESIGDNAIVETRDHRCEECRVADEAIAKAEGRA